jgi:hypothetical protein
VLGIETRMPGHHAPGAAEGGPNSALRTPPVSGLGCAVNSGAQSVDDAVDPDRADHDRLSVVAGERAREGVHEPAHQEGKKRSWRPWRRESAARPMTHPTKRSRPVPGELLTPVDGVG